MLPTDYEGQPFIIIEALAAGVPIVATAIPSIEGMIDDGEHGRLVQRTDTEGFATAIRDLLEDPERRRRISAANRRARRGALRPVGVPRPRRTAVPPLGATRLTPFPTAGPCDAALAGWAQLSANSPSATSRVTVSPSATSPSRSAIARRSPTCFWISRLSGRAP